MIRSRYRLECNSSTSRDFGDAVVGGRSMQQEDKRGAPATRSPAMARPWPRQSPVAASIRRWHVQVHGWTNGHVYPACCTIRVHTIMFTSRMPGWATVGRGIPHLNSSCRRHDSTYLQFLQKQIDVDSCPEIPAYHNVFVANLLVIGWSS